MKKAALILGAVLLVFIIIIMSAISVPEDSYVIIRRFNKVVRIHNSAGLAFKLPFLDDTTTLPKMLQTYNLAPSDILTKDKKSMIVDEYVVWKIEDPLLFLQTAGNITEIQRRLDASAYNTVKTLLSSMNQEEIISERGSALNDKITENIAELMKVYGLKVVDAQIQKFDLPIANKEAVYSRMISERKQIAAAYTAEGKEEAAMIKNETDKNKVVILAEAKSKAQKTIAAGEAEYMKILQDAYSTPERIEFYEFVRSLDALKVSMQGDKTIILPFDSPLAKWFIQN